MVEAGAGHDDEVAVCQLVGCDGCFQDALHVGQVVLAVSLEGVRGRTEQEFATARDFGVLMVEFSLYAMRSPAAQAAPAKRYRQLRGRLAALITRRYARRQTSPPLPPEHLAALVLATDAGLFLQDAAEPGALPWELHADAMIRLLDPPSRRASEPARTNLEP
jgi:hypothetical protein